MADIKTINAVPVAGIKTYDNIPLASVKTINALTMGAGAPAGPFEPDDLAGLVAWYKADAETYSHSAAQFVTANSEYLSRASNTSLQLGDIDWTVGGWAWLDTAGAYRIFMSKRNALSVFEFAIYNNTGTSTMTIQVSALAAGTVEGIGTGTWGFVVAWHDAAANTLNIQVNNGTVYSVATGGAFAPVSSDEFRIGAQGAAAGGELFWDGRIQNAFMFGRALDATERTFLYNGGTGRSYEELSSAFKANLRGWWPLDEAGGTRRDKHTFANHLTDVNTVAEVQGHILNPASAEARIYAWEDQSGHEYNLSQNVVTARPFRTLTGGQPVPVVATHGLSAAYGNFPATQLYTFFSVSKTTSGAIGIALSAGTAQHSQLLRNVGPCEASASSSTQVHTIATAPDTNGLSWHLEKILRDMGSVQIIASGAASPVVATPGTPASGTYPYYIGSSSLGFPWNGYLAEMIYYDRILSAGEQAQVEAYLTAKWLGPGSVAGLQAWYKADEGVYSQSAAWMTPANGECLTRDDSPSLQLGNIPWTIAGWFWPDTLSASPINVVLAKRHASVQVEYQISTTPTGTYFVVDNGAGVYQVVSAPALALGVWTWIVVSYDTAGGGTISIQINNGTPVSVAGIGAITAGTNPFGLGAIPSTAQYLWDGRQQNVCIFGRLLNATERSFLYNSGNGRAYEELDSAFKTDLRAWWPLDEGGGTRKDKHSFGNHLTDINTVGVAEGKILNPASDGALVREWRDQSGLGRHLYQASLTERPFYYTNAQNGLPVIWFYGTTGGQAHWLTSGLSILTQSALTAMQVNNPNSSNAGFLTGLTVGEPVMILLETSTDTAWYTGDTWYKTFYRDGVVTVAVDGAWHSYGVDPVATPASTTGINVGQDRSLANRNIAAKVGELIIYNVVLSPADRARVEAYLRSKWALP